MPIFMVMFNPDGNFINSVEQKRLKRRLSKQYVIDIYAVLILAVAGFLSAFQYADAATINNPGFEAGWKNWQVSPSASDDTAISEVARGGSKSAKITGREGRFEQCVVVSPGLDYELTAFIRGKGRFGAVIGKETVEIEWPGDGKNWAPILLSFNSGDEREIIIFGAFVSGDVRFDDVALAAISGRAPPIGSKEQQAQTADDDHEVTDLGCASDQPKLPPKERRTAKKSKVSPYGLKTGVPPSENFDLTDWKLTLPVDRDQDGRADEVSEATLADGWSDPTLFYTDPVTGGLVFRVPQRASATTAMSGYPRAELREMLRAGDSSVDTRGQDGTPNKNNWVMPSAPKIAQVKAGGVGGILRATLAVNQVTRVGASSKVGRVIIGQIHAKDHEVIRLYYRKLPTNSLGSIYYAHELGEEGEVYVDIIGDRGDFISNPENGIALDELFSYEIRLEDGISGQKSRSVLKVDIIRDSGARFSTKPLDLTDSVYVTEKDFLYFKAGAYSQNDGISQQDHDADQVTFFKLENSHGK